MKPKRVRRWLVCPDRDRPATGWTSRDIPIPSGHSTLEIGMAILDRLIRQHQAVVTAVDIGPDGTGSYIVRIPVGQHGADEPSGPAVPT